MLPKYSEKLRQFYFVRENGGRATVYDSTTLAALSIIPFALLLRQFEMPQHSDTRLLVISHGQKLEKLFADTCLI